MLKFIALLFCLFVVYLGIREILKIFASGSSPKEKFDTPSIRNETLYLWEKNKYTHSGFEVVGESYYQDNIKKMMYRNNLLATMTPEPNNQHDINAVRIDIDGRTVGYLSRDCNKQFKSLLLNAGLKDTDKTQCFASVIGGHTKNGKPTSYGIVLDF